MLLLNSHTIPNYRKKSRKMKIELINEKVFRVKFYTFPLIYPFFNCFFFFFFIVPIERKTAEKSGMKIKWIGKFLFYIFFSSKIKLRKLIKNVLFLLWLIEIFSVFLSWIWKGWRNWWKFFMEVVGGVRKLWGPYYTTKYQPLPRIHQNHRLSSTKSPLIDDSNRYQ